MKVKLRKLSYIFYYFFMLFITYFFKKIFVSFNSIWIISERGFDCRDNGYHLFKYINSLSNPPKNFFVIEKNSEDRAKLINHKNIIFRGTFKHWFYFSISKVKISTHIMGYSPDMYIFNWLDRFNLVFGKKIFIQHGVIYNDLPGLYSKNINLDLFISGAIKEKEFISENFGYSEKVLKHTGLCRYDSLHTNQIVKSSPKNLLIMPTWRSWIQDCKSEEDFKETEYFIKYNALINNIELQKALEDNNLNLLFYPHYEVQKFIGSFKNVHENPRIKILSKKDTDVQELLILSSLLITDYSSVFFDFIYMLKPVIFFNFDHDLFFKNHYSKGYIDINNNVYGKSCNQESDLLIEIENAIKKDFIVDLNTQKSIKKFFGLIDNFNTKRNFEAILELLNEEN